MNKAFTDLAADLNGKLFQQGIEVRTGRDLEEYSKIVSKGREGHPVSQAFWPSEVGDAPVMWFAAFDNDGLIHTQACRKLPRAQETLAAYLSENYLRFPPPNFPVDEEASRFLAGPGAHAMSGDIIYHGESWLKQGKYRGTGLASQLAKFSFLQAASEIGFDHMFGFMTNPVAHKGFFVRMGFPHADFHALRWVSQGHTRIFDAMMVYMSIGDLEFLAKAELDQLKA